TGGRVEFQSGHRHKTRYLTLEHRHFTQVADGGSEPGNDPTRPAWADHLPEEFFDVHTDDRIKLSLPRDADFGRVCVWQTVYAQPVGYDNCQRTDAQIGDG